MHATANAAAANILKAVVLSFRGAKATARIRLEANRSFVAAMGK
jgi:hypothetical protein